MHARRRPYGQGLGSQVSAGPGSRVATHHYKIHEWHPIQCDICGQIGA
jgi:hypothetical protein